MLGHDRTEEEEAAFPLTLEVPLSRGQRALWFLDRLAPGASAYVLAGAMRVEGPLDVPALREAATALSARHPAFRTRFVAPSGNSL